MDESTARTLTRVYTALSWIGALFLLIAAISILFFLPNIMATAMQDPQFAADVAQIPQRELEQMFKVMSIVGSIICFAGAVVLTWTGFGLWRYRNWARITAMVLSVLGLLIGLNELLVMNFASAAFSFIVYGVALWLFGFEPTVRSLFSAPKAVAKKAPAKKKRAKR